MRIREDIRRADRLFDRIEREIGKTQHREDEVDAGLAELEMFAARVDRVVQACQERKEGFEAPRREAAAGEKKSKDKGK